MTTAPSLAKPKHLHATETVKIDAPPAKVWDIIRKFRRYELAPGGQSQHRR